MLSIKTLDVSAFIIYALKYSFAENGCSEQLSKEYENLAFIYFVVTFKDKFPVDKPSKTMIISSIVSLKFI